MILLIGASGHIGRAFQTELNKRHLKFRCVSRQQYSDFEWLYYFLKENRPDFVICAAGFTGDPNVDACEDAKAETILGNVVLPTIISNACAACRIPLGFVSSGCIYDSTHCHQPPDGFTERDEPNFNFVGKCSFYSGCKELAERAVLRSGRAWAWRIRMPFSEVPGLKNLLTKLLNYPLTFDSPPNSLSHLGESISACIDIMEGALPYGAWNIVNPGAVTNREIVGLIKGTLGLSRDFTFLDELEFYRTAAKAPRSNCVLSCKKLLAAGIQMRDVREALADSLKNWKAQ